ncbi:MAG: FAD-dependent oxidoreductase [Chloroflexota bacterium]|nr:FAD-dependent oxidoreductase [Chloroflexota bacterium]
MSKAADVVVVGGGVAGCATAYYLAREGVRVTLVERESLGHGASGFSLGRVDGVAGDIKPGDMEALAARSFELHLELWPTLRGESGVDVQGKLVTSLELCMTDEDVPVRKKEMAHWAKAPGYKVYWLSREDVLKLEPRISPQVRGAGAIDYVGVFDSYRFTVALAQSAERHGLTVRSGSVRGLRRRGSRATGVLLESGETLPCDAVVIATGPWAGEASEWLGVKIPVVPSKGQIVYLEGVEPPIVPHIHGPISILHKIDGKVCLAATRELKGFDTTTTPEARDELMAKGVQTMPCLENARLVLQTACLRPLSPDEKPIMGPVPGCENAYFIGGGYSKGVMLAPAMGKAIADLVLKGKTDMPIEGLGLARFNP